MDMKFRNMDNVFYHQRPLLIQIYNDTLLKVLLKYYYYQTILVHKVYNWYWMFQNKALLNNKR